MGLSRILLGPKPLMGDYAAHDQTITNEKEKSAEIHSRAKIVLAIAALVTIVALIVVLAVFASPAIPVIATTAAGIVAASGGTYLGIGAAVTLGLSVPTLILSAMAAINNRKSRVDDILSGG